MPIHTHATLQFIPGECRIRINGCDFDPSTYIPVAIIAAIAAGMPEGWKVDNRGSRIEVYPPRANRGVIDPSEHQLIVDACVGAGLTTETV